MHDALVVILPDGRSKEFPLPPGQASRFFVQERNVPSEDLLHAAEPMLDETVRERFRNTLKGEVDPGRRSRFLLSPGLYFGGSAEFRRWASRRRYRSSRCIPVFDLSYLAGGIIRSNSYPQTAHEIFPGLS